MLTKDCKLIMNKVKQFLKNGIFCKKHDMSLNLNSGYCLNLNNWRSNLD